MTGLEALLLAPLYAYFRGLDDPAEAARRQAAGAEAATQEAAKTASLLQVRDACDEGHKALTAAWRGPISLFGPAAQQDTLAKGVPTWVIDYVLQAKKLVDEFSEMSDRTDGYVTQIDVAKSDANREILWEGVNKLTGRLRSLNKRMYVLLPHLQTARSALDNPASVAIAPSPEEKEPEPALPKLSSSGSISSGSNVGGSPKAVPLKIVQLVAAPSFLGAAAQQTLAIPTTMHRGIDRQCREKPLLKAWLDYSAWHGLSVWVA